ncbi:fibroblast growth factor-binding protein 1-like [Carassius auratus]|uniref:Fibroblast growth factor-binding protein 1-like n=1 Tax=Carassius auratus TaxID=7957 RepID=A0A6P6NU26_CARAU|nr:fibroblast growth factor-binding protein 1-like [Carassius auratus]
MSLRGTVVLLLLLCLSQLIFAADSIREARSKGKRLGSRVDKNISVHKGKFIIKDKAKCSWVARGEDIYTMTVRCKPRNEDGFSCKYTAKPSTCTEYGSNPKGYWKQIGRSVAIQKTLCADARALIRTGMCKRAPLAAHFKLTEISQEKPPTEKTPTTTSTKLQCTERTDHSEVAKEMCGDSWASLCAFVFTIVQSGDC